MSEEEKIKVINKFIKKFDKQFKTGLVKFDGNDFYIAYNIVKEQQKEIEELKDITRAYDGMKGIMPEGCPIVIADKEYFDSGRFIEKYISKDKIREKIEFYKRYGKIENSNEYVMSVEIEVLEELLEEGE